MILKACEEDIPERARIALREAAISIGDIANNLLCKYKKEDTEASATEEQQPLMVSLALLQLLSEKRHQYKELPVEFAHSFCPDCNFTFIKSEPISFKRMMSNLVNNAVDAFDGREGKVDLILNVDDKQVKIVVQDNGKGMSQEVIHKIMSNIAVTVNKKSGHGIGFTQIRDTLVRNQGMLAIDSKVNYGTKIILTFPMIVPPEWVAKAIKLNKGDTVIVLDDDESIHHAWRSRFKEYDRDIALEHFTLGKEAIDFINAFPEKGKLFLLADFELLKQELNGLHVINRTEIKRSILVTSHYTNLVVRNLAIKNETKILPKPLASEVPIEVRGESASSNKDDNHFVKCDKNNKGGVTIAKRGKNANNFRRVDLVLLDDDEMLIDALASLLETKGKVVDKYYKPTKFLEKLSQYGKDTKIFMDNDFKSSMGGIELAKQLHKNGYTKLFLFSGKDFTKGEIPDYLTVISKTDTDKLIRFVG